MRQQNPQLNRAFHALPIFLFESVVNVVVLGTMQWAGIHTIGGGLAVLALAVLVVTFLYSPRAQVSRETMLTARLIAMLAVQLGLLALFGSGEPLDLLGLILIVVGSGAVVRIVAQEPLPFTVQNHIRLRLLALIFIVIIVNSFLLRAFNTLIWPFLWPQPLLFILIIGLVVLTSLPRLRYNIWLVRIVGVLMIFIGECYLIHTVQVTLREPNLLTIAHLIGFTGIYAVFVVGTVNQFSPRDQRKSPPLPERLPHVAAVIPTYGEPYEVVEETLRSLLALDWPAEHLTVVISDDAHREDLQAMAKRYGVHYNFGAKKDAKAGNLNSALHYLAMHVPYAEFILTQDADEVVHPSFLKRTIGFFTDEKMAFVQTPKDAAAPSKDPFGTRDRLFYDVFQVGRNGFEAAMACGSGVIWRMDAVRKIGGFSTWNVVEDLTTSYHLHAAGYKSEYLNEVLSIGLAPDDIPGLLKQRGTWAVDTWRLFLFDNPVFKKGLTVKQRAQYTELGLFYATSALFTPLLMLVPLVSLITGYYVPIEGAALFPWVFVSVIYYIVLARGRITLLIRMWQYWVGHFATYFRAFLIALPSRKKKPGYKVTRKTRQDGFYGIMIWPQFIYLLAGFYALYHAFIEDPGSAPLGARLTNAGILLFFMFMVSGIARAAFWNSGPGKLIERRQEAARERRAAASGGD
jgi:cellulose synthase (UDP-forming)